MYSKNDYRYYLENQLMHSDDFLAHYGVKGMKWKKHKKQLPMQITSSDPNHYQRSRAIDPDLRRLNQEWYNTQIDQERGKQRTSDFYQRRIGQDQARGRKKTANIRSRQTLEADQNRGKKRTEQLRKSYREGIPDKIEYDKKVPDKIVKDKKSTTSKKKKKKNLFKRETPKGKKLKGSNIYVDHNVTIK